MLLTALWGYTKIIFYIISFMLLDIEIVVEASILLLVVRMLNMSYALLTNL